MPHMKDLTAFEKNNEDLNPISVLVKFAPLVKLRALHFSSNENELEDLIQEGNIGLYNAISRFDGERSSFKTFATRCIDSAIIDYLRKSGKNSVIPAAMKVDIEGIDIADKTPGPEYTVSIKDEYSALVKKAKAELSSFEFSVFSSLLSGASKSQIAKEQKVDTKSINNAVFRIRAKLK